MEKMKEKIFTMIVSLALVFSIFPKPEIRAASQTGKCGANITWELDDNMTLTLSGSGGTWNYWTESSQSPFYSLADKIKKVVIKDGITGLGDYLFYNCSLISAVEFPNSLSTIGRGLFSCCSSLKSISLPNNLSKLGSGVFYRTGLEELVIPEGIPYVPSALCQSCGSLKKVTIPQSCTAIYDYAFYKCEKLESIEIPSNVELISYDAFQYCTSLTSVTIPENVKSLGFACFDHCSNLRNVFIMGSPQEEWGVFVECSPYLVKHYAYDVIYTNDGNGTISGKNRSVGTDVIELTVVPKNEAFVLDKLVLTNADHTLNYDIQVSPDANNKVRFTMPDSSSRVTINATFKVAEKTVTFNDDDGRVYKVIQVAYGDIPVYTGIEPTKEETDECTYTFFGWKDSTYFYSKSDPLPAVIEDVTYTAVFKEAIREYEVSFVDEEGNELQSGKIEYGEIPTYTGTEQTKEETDEFTYSFAGWSDGTTTYGVSDPLPAVTGDAIYTVVFAATKRDYEISFVDEDGNELQSGKIEYGEIPTYTGTEQTKEETDEFTYSFAGWSDGTTTYGVSDPLPAVTGDATYTAVFTKTEKPTEPSETAQIIAPTKPAEPTEKVPGEYYLVSITGEGENSDIVIIVKRTEDDAHCIDYLDKIEADGKVLTIGQQCTVKSGSTIITLKKAYLETLTEGSHTLKVFFNDGGSINVNFMVKFPKAQAKPKTGETVSAASMVGAGLILVACVAAGAVVIRRRKEINL